MKPTSHDWVGPRRGCVHVHCDRCGKIFEIGKAKGVCRGMCPHGLPLADNGGRMNDGTTISTFQLFQMFPDAESARVYLESRLWPNGCRCPICGLGERITARKGGYYRCNQCKEDFTVRTGTIFERSHVPLHNWVYAMYLLVTARKGISSLQLSKEIGITQKSAWFVLHRLREACGGELAKLDSFVAATARKRLTYARLTA